MNISPRFLGQRRRTHHRCRVLAGVRSFAERAHEFQALGARLLHTSRFKSAGCLRRLRPQGHDRRARARAPHYKGREMREDFMESCTLQPGLDRDRALANLRADPFSCVAEPSHNHKHDGSWKSAGSSSQPEKRSSPPKWTTPSSSRRPPSWPTAKPAPSGPRSPQWERPDAMVADLFRREASSASCAPATPDRQGQQDAGGGHPLAELPDVEKVVATHSQDKSPEAQALRQRWPMGTGRGQARVRSTMRLRNGGPRGARQRAGFDPSSRRR